MAAFCLKQRPGMNYCTKYSDSAQDICRHEQSENTAGSSIGLMWDEWPGFGNMRHFLGSQQLGRLKWLLALSTVQTGRKFCEQLIVTGCSSSQGGKGLKAVL